MEDNTNDKYKDMTVEEIITDLYDQHQKEMRKCATTMGRFLLGAAIAVFTGIVLALYQWLGDGFSWG